MRLYHGTPIGALERSASVMRGRYLCLSFSWAASSSRAGRYLGSTKPCALAYAELAGGLLLDCGAYSSWTSGQVFDLQAVEHWYRSMLAAFPSKQIRLVIPDVIEGSEAQNDKAITDWPSDLRSVSIPVWHSVEPIERAISLAQDWPLIGVGACGQHRNVNHPPFFTRMVELFDALPKQTFHLFRGIQMAGGPFPFQSADSTDLGQNKSRTVEQLSYFANQWDRRAATTAKRWIGASLTTQCRHRGWDELRQTAISFDNAR